MTQKQITMKEMEAIGRDKRVSMTLNGGERGKLVGLKAAAVTEPVREREVEVGSGHTRVRARDEQVWLSRRRCGR